MLRMDIKFIKLASFVLSIFFFLTLFSRLCNMINVDLYIQQLMSVTFLLGGFFSATRIKFHRFDILMVLYLFYIIFNGIVIDYDYHSVFLYKALLSHIFPMMCYFVGRYTNVAIEKYLENMKWPLIFAMICGIIFYFIQPSWYVIMKESQLRAGATDSYIAEIYRLSSFWGHPYVIGYATLLYSIYETFLITKGLKSKKSLYYHLLTLFICLIVLMLAQLRVTLFIYVCSLLYMILFAQKSSLSKKIRLIFSMVFLILIFSIFFIRIAAESMDYITGHMLQFFESDSMSNRFEHTAGGIESYTLLGDGLGRYGYLAREYGKWAIVDNQFQCHLAELGYIGFTLLLFILFFTLKKCIRQKSLLIENSIFAFFCVAMLGASVLSNHHQFNYLFWYIVGCLWTQKKKINKLEQNKVLI